MRTATLTYSSADTPSHRATMLDAILLISRRTHWRREQIGQGVTRCPRDPDLPAREPMHANYGALPQP